MNNLSYISNQPNPSVAIAKWQSNIKFFVITSSIIDFEASSTSKEINFSGVVQPLSPAELILKPQEQRSWDWLQVHSFSGNILNNGDKISFKDKNYRVMLNNDYSLNGFIEYHLVEDFVSGA